MRVAAGDPHYSFGLPPRAAKRLVPQDLNRLLAWRGDPTPGIRSSYDESPEAQDGHKEDSLWERATAPN
ncbi:MAG: hypothetical protein M3Q49_13560, partial [Actinomycetota bacterium]|nr:hypothetical protein [Actinomycetota bacterium]